MYGALSPHAVGVYPRNLEAALVATRRGGFEGLEFDSREIADLVGRQGGDVVRAMFTAAGVRPAGWGLPFDWRGSEESWREGLEELPRLARAAAVIGGERVYTWVLPGSDELGYADNRRFHLDRLSPIADVLASEGCRLGLEYVGPETLRAGFRYPFIYRMGEMVELGAELGTDVGLLVDCWHWYTSGGTVEELRSLRPEEVVYVHVNDAPPGVPVDEQVDSVRALPGETGVIDIVGFLGALATVGYDGPVVPEPFKSDLADLPSDDARLELVGASLATIFRRAVATGP